ncbi:hypothetical protein KN815_06085 [Streptomyces sp. 4503]|uniref:Uncharacterized protein n=1 Tax=Streptomyces niphimycinicus TaxID=2842201 RepID=A0ABS6C9V4_9ACTN|nr:hypothetical protein [Streptomyces niphimycinicus]MBU3863673.1 hypothetical protein [Streptomyces niphimycinicus]
MAEFLRGAPERPAVRSGLTLLVVAGHRLAVRIGGAGGRAHGGDGVRAGTVGTRRTAVAVAGIALAWFVALAGDALTDRHWLRIAVLPAVAGAGWAGVRLQRRLPHRPFPPAGPLDRPRAGVDRVVSGM